MSFLYYPSVSLQVNCIPCKGPCTHDWSPGFGNCQPGNIPSSPSSHGRQSPWLQALWNEKMKCWSVSRVWLFVTLCTVAQQALSMGFSRQEYWSGLPFLSPGYPSDPGIESGSSALQADSSSSEPPAKPFTRKNTSKRKWRHGGKDGGCTRQSLGGGCSQAHPRKSCLSGEKLARESHD